MWKTSSASPGFVHLFVCSFIDLLIRHSLSPSRYQASCLSGRMINGGHLPRIPITTTTQEEILRNNNGWVFVLLSEYTRGEGHRNVEMKRSLRREKTGGWERRIVEKRSNRCLSGTLKTLCSSLFPAGKFAPFTKSFWRCSGQGCQLKAKADKGAQAGLYYTQIKRCCPCPQRAHGPMGKMLQRHEHLGWHIPRRESPGPRAQHLRGFKKLSNQE